MSGAKLCLGTVQFGMKYGIKNELGRQPEKDECFAVLHCALKAGIASFDTASAYGDAELLLGEFPWGEEMPHIISKLSPGCEDSADAALEQVRCSLGRLRCEHIYGYMLHRAEDIGHPGIMAGLQAAKLQGLVDKIGVSVYQPEDAMRAAMDERIDIIQIPYNALDRRLDNLSFFDQAEKNGKEVYARSPFLQGLLLMERDEVEQRLPGFGAYVEQFRAIARKHGFSPAEAAFLFSFCHPGIDYVVFGVDTPEQLAANLGITAKAESFAGCREALLAEFSDVPERLINPSLW